MDLSFVSEVEKKGKKTPNKGHLVCFWLHKIAIGYLQTLLPQECGARSNIFVNKVLLLILTYKFIKNLYFFPGMKTICLKLLFYHLILLYQLTQEQLNLKHNPLQLLFYHLVFLYRLTRELLNLKHKPLHFYYSDSKGMKWPNDNIGPPYHYSF
jgi:hypothetical protein